MARIDHLVYAVPELNAAIEQFSRTTGVRPAMGGAHVGLGTHNALVSFGPSYLELIAPDPGQDEPAGPRPFGIDELAEPAFVAFAVRPDPGDSIDALATRATAAGYDPGPISDMQRATPGGGLLQWRLTMPPSSTPPSVVPFLIDWGDTPLPSDTQPGGVDLISFSIRHPDAAGVSDTLAALGVDVPVAAGPPALEVTIVGPGGEFATA